MTAKIKEFIRLHETKIVLASGFILVAVLSFEAGIMKGKNIKQNPIIVKAGGNEAVCGVSSSSPPEAQNLASEEANGGNEGNTPASDCAFMGSKNSNKYHLPTCRYAQKIKQENITCFKDKNEAESKGYLPDKGCIK